MNKSLKLMVGFGALMISATLPHITSANEAYSSFVASPDQMLRAASSDYRRCLDLAGQNTSARASCVRSELPLLERRLFETHRSKLANLTNDMRRVVRREQQTWERLRLSSCETANRKYYNDSDMPDYVRFVNQCVLSESLRRIVWLNAPTG